MKIKKELFENKRHRLVRVVYISIDSVSGIIILYDFVAKLIQKENFYLSASKHQQAKFCLFLDINLLVQLFHLLLKFHLSKLLRNEKPFWIPSQNSEYPRIFQATGANQNAQILLSTNWVNTTYYYYHNYY